MITNTHVVQHIISKGQHRENRACDSSRDATPLRSASNAQRGWLELACSELACSEVPSLRGFIATSTLLQAPELPKRPTRLWLLSCSRKLRSLTLPSSDHQT